MKKKRAPSLRVADAWAHLDFQAPFSCEEEWDNGGLILGDPDWKARKVLVSGDLTSTLLKQVKKEKANLLVLHHPPIFPKSKGISKLVRSGDPNQLSDLLLECAQEKIAILVSHTSFDRSCEEVSRELARALGFKAMGKLYPENETLLKLRVFIPPQSQEKVRNALFGAGAGQIGNYDSCSFQSVGEGTFRGLQGASPAIGKKGRKTQVKEVVLEVVLPSGLKNQVLAALKGSHPYEEPAFDLISVLQSPSRLGFPKGIGYGFWAIHEEGVWVQDFEDRLRKVFEIPSVLRTGEASRQQKLKKIAFSPGKGSLLRGAAERLGCDAVVTGEVDYHDALALARRGSLVYELGHSESERFTILGLSRWLKEAGFQATPWFSQLQRVCGRDYN